MTVELATSIPLTIRLHPHHSLLSSNWTTVTTVAELPQNTPLVKPFLKWAGGKQWLTPIARSLLPEDFAGTYFEPFLGAGSLFFATVPRRAILADINDELAITYQAIQRDVEQVISLLESYPHNKCFYDFIRLSNPTEPHLVAARLIYLNKTAFNGLYRVNLNGQFNVPFGRFRNPTICQHARLHQCAQALSSANIYCADFESVLTSAQAGDFVFLDPPYITGHTNNGFLKYNSRLFSWSDQLRLASVAQRLAKSGVHIVVSTATYPILLGLYAGFFHYKLERNSLISGERKARGIVTESLLTSQPIADLQTEKL